MESCRANLIANLLAQSGAAPEKANVPLPEPVVSVAHVALQELSAGNFVRTSGEQSPTIQP
jgi:hypothetical protein